MRSARVGSRARVVPVDSDDCEAQWADLNALDALDAIESGRAPRSVGRESPRREGAIYGDDCGPPKPYYDYGPPKARPELSAKPKLTRLAFDRLRPDDDASPRPECDTPGTGSTKRVSSSRSRGRATGRRKPLSSRGRPDELYSAAGLSLADRMRRSDGGAADAQPAPRDHPACDVADLAPDALQTGLAARLGRQNSEPHRSVSPNDDLPSAATLHAALVDKQQRAARRKEANKAARRSRHTKPPRLP
ncbi:hypothetical protein M885DRAFT_592539 [Pelagophyceae sp. CCMP2097]|nr:hypothetical protein M885DRAFT_592539 [Pelagophyceae sp. CCMP2097]